MFIGGTESSGDRGDIPFLSGTMVHRDLMDHDEAGKDDDDDEYGSEISDTGEYIIFCTKSRMKRYY